MKLIFTKVNTGFHGRLNKFLYSPPKVLVTFLFDTLLNTSCIQTFMSESLHTICDATETGGTPPVTMTNETTPPPWRWQAALV